ncbi:hypothetical protein GS896_25550 [Rhodococcus hoagii]|nr:hypothetical protein [Prescottella equi]MBM4654128.1 hypothetical protein [Prescottella equi]MBM4717738.1 hypothetical protein [Prescottella equi]MBM4719603.1 hypothetical protein [Prescottella equi]NKR23401.1 hypothetical protein [Prescottella equi]
MTEERDRVVLGGAVVHSPRAALRLRQLYELRHTQSELAQLFRDTESAVGHWLRHVRNGAPDVLPGTTGGTPYPRAARKAVGEAGRAACAVLLTGEEQSCVLDALDNG